MAWLLHEGTACESGRTIHRVTVDLVDVTSQTRIKMWPRFLLGGLAILALIALFWFQFRLTNTVSREEDIAADHLEHKTKSH